MNEKLQEVFDKHDQSIANLSRMADMFENLSNKYKLRLTDDDMMITTTDFSNPVSPNVELSLNNLIENYQTQKTVKNNPEIIYVYKENHEKFLRTIKKEVPTLVKKIAKNCSTVVYEEPEEDDEEEQERQDKFTESEKKYIVIKIPYKLKYGTFEN